MNGYICFYKGKQIEVHAETTYAAQVKAAEVLRVTPKNRYQITVVLAEKGGEQVTHVPVD